MDYEYESPILEEEPVKKKRKRRGKIKKEVKEEVTSEMKRCILHILSECV